MVPITRTKVQQCQQCCHVSAQGCDLADARPFGRSYVWLLGLDPPLVMAEIFGRPWQLARLPCSDLAMCTLGFLRVTFKRHRWLAACWVTDGVADSEAAGTIGAVSQTDEEMWIMWLTGCDLSNRAPVTPVWQVLILSVHSFKGLSSHLTPYHPFGGRVVSGSSCLIDLFLIKCECVNEQTVL